jgi:uncharacterized protein YjiS (DUF1127 family)
MVANDAIRSRLMSTYFSDTNWSTERCHRSPPASQHQSSSWQRLCNTLLRWAERRRPRASYRELADNPHLLKDLGLSRHDLGLSCRETLGETDKPFWR